MRRQVQKDTTAASPLRSRRRTVLFALLAVVLSVFFALFLLEVVMRLYAIRPARHKRPYPVIVSGGITLPDGRKMVKVPSRFETLGTTMGEYVPGSVYKSVYDSNPDGFFDLDYSITYRINSLGMRGPDASETPTSGTRRMLFLGDSFTFGAGVRDEHTFVRRIETALKDSGRAWQTLNAGVEGYNTHDEVLVLEHRWLRLQPDVVVVVFYLNDAYADQTFLNQGELQGVHFGQPKGFAAISYVYDYAQHTLRARAESKKIERYYAGKPFKQAGEFLNSPAQREVDWGRSRAALEKLRSLADAHGFRPAVVIFPELHELTSQYPFASVHETVRTTCARLKLPCLDLLDAFKGKNPRSLWVHPADHHPNPAAHAIASDAILGFLDEQGMLR